MLVMVAAARLVRFFFVMSLVVLMLGGVDGIAVDGHGNNMRLNHDWVSVGLVVGTLKTSR